MLMQPLEQKHYPSVKEIYELGIVTGNATFETEAPSWETWDKNHLKICRIVVVDEKENVTGWAALSPVSERCVNGGVAEGNVYIHSGSYGQSISQKILAEIIRRNQ